MIMLRIEHAVSDYDAWKHAFDSDPVGRKRSGVRRYAISRAVGDPNRVLIDLEFATQTEAQGLLTAMRAVWGRVEGTLIQAPQARIVEVVEAADV